MILSRKQSMTFIELLISMGLTALILMTLLYFYRDIDWLNNDMENSQKEAFKTAFVQNRLADVLPSSLTPRLAEKDFYFFLSHDANGLLKPNNPSLVFTYNFGPSRDSSLAYYVLGRLYLDNENRLVLSTMPTPSRWDQVTKVKLRKEVLLENVDSILFRFYVPPKKDLSLVGNAAPKGILTKGKADTEVEGDRWYEDWKSEYEQLPAMIEVILKLDKTDEPLKFVFPLPLSEHVILYEN